MDEEVLLSLFDQGTLSLETKVWHKDLPIWTTAGSVDLIAGHLAAQDAGPPPPPLTEASADAPESHEPAMAADLNDDDFEVDWTDKDEASFMGRIRRRMEHDEHFKKMPMAAQARRIEMMREGAKRAKKLKIINEAAAIALRDKPILTTAEGIKSDFFETLGKVDLKRSGAKNPELTDYAKKRLESLQKLWKLNHQAAEEYATVLSSFEEEFETIRKKEKQNLIINVVLWSLLATPTIAFILWIITKE